MILCVNCKFMWPVDLNWFLQFVVRASAAAVAFLYVVRSTASRFFVVDSNFGSTIVDFSTDRNNRERMAAAVIGAAQVSYSCAVCGFFTKKKCSRCRMVKYCSEVCQRSHWNEHKTKCKDLQPSYKVYHTNSTNALRESKVSPVPAGGSSKIFKQSNKILFPYEQFVQFFNWEMPGSPPCGLLNCGNSCFANVVLQCLAYTRPLVAYLLEKDHKRECWMNGWCFLCEFQTHVERANHSRHPFSPINILSRLSNIGGNLGHGRQEDAHEFMRFVIDRMQSVCLDEFGGEKAVHSSYKETTLVQHIFGGRLQSQVICTKCNKVSDQFENMMDLTVEIHGDAESLEECLGQFTAKESLHGDNMYKCDGCSDYVKAWKRLAVRRAPNILTIALKRFQSGRFGKLNKRVTFPETLDLSSYISELEDGSDVYKLYAVIVHVDMLNASFFGHYICYVKDFHGNWFRIDDCKVCGVDLDEVLSQGAYMLLYSRICARPSCLLPAATEQENKNMKIQTVDPSLTQPLECLSAALLHSNPVNSKHLSSPKCSAVEVNCEEDLSSIKIAEDSSQDVEMVSCDTSLPIVNIEPHDRDGLSISPREVTALMQLDVNNFEQASPISDFLNAGRCNKGDPDEGVLRMPSVESSAAKYCTLEKDNTNDISSITTGEFQNENYGNPTFVPSVESSAAAVEKDNIDYTSSITTSDVPGENSASPTTVLSVGFSAVEKCTIEKDSPDDISSITIGGDLDENSANPTSVPFVESITVEKESMDDISSITIGEVRDEDSTNPISVEFSAVEKCTIEKDSPDDISFISTSGFRDRNSANPTSLPSVESSAVENCTVHNEKDSTDDISSITTDEVRDEDSANPMPVTEKVKCEGNDSVLRDHDAKYASKKSNGKIPEWKPRLPPGFLGKPPQKSLIKPTKITKQVGESTPKLHLKYQTNEIVKPCFWSENGSPLKDEEKPYFVLENGTIYVYSAACRNGDSGRGTASSERTKTNMNSERRLQVVR